MKFVIVFVALFALAYAAPASQGAEILRHDSDVGPESFQYAYETSDGQSADAQGQLGNIGTDHESLSVKGSYRFVADDGVTYEVTYIADENGFQPSGAHLPVAPQA